MHVCGELEAECETTGLMGLVEGLVGRSEGGLFILEICEGRRIKKLGLFCSLCTCTETPAWLRFLEFVYRVSDL